jgi:hypothetical protein
MVPRTNDHGGRGAQHYLCNGRQIAGCHMPLIHRVDVDAAIYRYFEQVALDVEATRRAVLETRDRKVAEIREVLAQAERERQRGSERLTRVRRHFQDGKLDPDDWAEQRAELASELAGAEAEVERLRAQAAEVTEWADLHDAEQATLERLTEIRAVIASDVRSAEGVDAVRAALRRSFDRFVLHRSAPDRVHVELASAAWWIEPVVREEAIEGYSESLQPVLRRAPLDQAVAAPPKKDARAWGIS